MRRITDVGYDAAPVDGRSSRWDDHRASRRTELIRAASRAIHHRGPGASMEEIAAASGTSKPILYRYFTDRTGLQIALGEALFARTEEALAGAARAAATPEQALAAMIRVYLETIEASPNVYYFVTRTGAVTGSDSYARSPLSEFLEAVIALVAEPFADQGRMSGSDAALWAAGAVGHVRGAGEWWLTHAGQPGTLALDQLTDQVATWLTCGLAAAAPEKLPAPSE